MKQLVVISLLTCSIPAIAQVRVGTMPPDIKVNVQGGPGTVELRIDEPQRVIDLVDLLAKVTNKNVMIKAGTDPKQLVTFYATGTFPNSEVYELIVSALATAKLGLEHHGRYIRIVPREG